MDREGVHDAFAEVSSIGIAEGRVDVLNFSACLFTNLGRDHLDYHGTIEAAGRPTGIIGTIGIFIRDREIYHGLTTPESVDFESSLAQMDREGVHDAFAEVSSIGIAEGDSIDVFNFSACLFTSLGRDHLDYHGTIENYFAAKLRLFTRDSAPGASIASRLRW